VNLQACFYPKNKAKPFESMIILHFENCGKVIKTS
jgi:hypothetical protein